MPRLSMEQERERLFKMHEYERMYADRGLIAGIDEAGRGPLFGPVTAAAVILDPDTEILYLNDSKKLSEKRRALLYDEIMKKAIAVGVGMVSARLIDDMNILQATYEAMREAAEKLSPRPDFILIDAVTIPHFDIPQLPIIKGDAKSASIAAASIIAKVTRDRLMDEYDKEYPGYGLAKNKGYGTAEHIEALRRLGPTPLHRRSFIKHFTE